jgi:hypothetical protein
MSAFDTAEEYAAALKNEYSQFVARAAIYVGGARAFNPGHPVPASHVEANPEWVTEGLVGPAGEEPPAPAVAPVVPPQGEDIPLSN